MLLLMLLQVSLCTGRITDKLPHPMLALGKPAPGQTYYDPAFGARVTRITAANPADGELAVIVPMYSTMPMWNADETRAIVYDRKNGHLLKDGKTYQFIRKLEPFHPTDIEQLLWDPADPNALYYPTNYNAVPWLIKQTLNPWEARIIHNFATAPTNCPVGDWGKLLKLGSDPQWMGYARKVVGLQCGDTKFLYSISEDKVLAVGPAATPNAPIVGPTEVRVWLDGYLFDLGLHNLGKLPMANPGEHAAMGRDAAGHDRWHAVAFDDPPNLTGSLVSWDLITKVPRVVVGPAAGWPAPGSSTHLSATAQRAPGWVAVGTVGGIPWGQGVLQNEVILGNVDTGEVCRLAHARTQAGADCGPKGDQCKWGYWGETHPVLSPSGTRIAFASDWMGSDTVDTYVVEVQP